LPSGVTPVDMPVYQYINVTPARYKLISAALIEFEVPLFSIVDHHASENNVWLCVLMNRTWVNLPTYTSGSKDGKVHYHAESPEFSLFAITIRNEKSIESPESILMVSTVSGKRTGFESQESNISAIPKNPVKIAQGSSNTGFSLLFIIISIMGMIGIVIGVVLIRSGWVHR